MRAATSGSRQLGGSSNRGAARPQGPQRPQAPQGPQGPQGPSGPAGIANVTRVSGNQVTLCGSSTDCAVATSTATCPSGSVAVGGGYAATGLVVVPYSQANTATSYSAIGANLSAVFAPSATASATLTAHAICARGPGCRSRGRCVGDAHTVHPRSGAARSALPGAAAETALERRRWGACQAGRVPSTLAPSCRSSARAMRASRTSTSAPAHR
jgi:hypothetical protein